MTQGVSPYYVGLNPGPHHLAAALHHLLLANRWLPVTLIADDSPHAQTIRHVLVRSSVDSSKVGFFPPSSSAICCPIPTTTYLDCRR